MSQISTFILINLLSHDQPDTFKRNVENKR